VSDARGRYFEEMFQRTSPSILGYLMRRVDSSEDAADLMAEVFAIAWRRVDDVPPGDAARLWLYGVARNVLSNHQRSRSRRGRLADRLREHLAVRAQSEHEPDAVPAVREALAELAERDRELLMLSAWEGMTPGEIAVVLDLPPAIVRTRLCRARSRLRDVLATRLTPDR
jgi:RNA polymerase sigma-70 factor, ECF subfamily